MTLLPKYNRDNFLHGLYTISFGPKNVRDKAKEYISRLINIPVNLSFKTINNESILGTGNINIGGLFSGTLDDVPDGTTYKRVTQTEKNTWNLGKVGTKEVNEASIGNNKILVYNSISDKLEYQTNSSGFVAPPLHVVDCRLSVNQYPNVLEISGSIGSIEWNDTAFPYYIRPCPLLISNAVGMIHIFKFYMPYDYNAKIMFDVGLNSNLSVFKIYDGISEIGNTINCYNSMPSAALNQDTGVTQLFTKGLNQIQIITTLARGYLVIKRILLEKV